MLEHLNIIENRVFNRVMPYNLSIEVVVHVFSFYFNDVILTIL